MFAFSGTVYSESFIACSLTSSRQDLRTVPRRIAYQDKIKSALSDRGGSRIGGGFEGQITAQSCLPETMLLSCQLGGAGRQR